MEVLKWKTSQITAKQAKRILHPELSFGLKEKKKEFISVSCPIHLTYQKGHLVILEFKPLFHIAKAYAQHNERVLFPFKNKTVQVPPPKTRTAVLKYLFQNMS